MKDAYFIIHYWIEEYKKFTEVYKGLIYTDYEKIKDLCIELNASADDLNFYEIKEGRLIE